MLALLTHFKHPHPLIYQTGIKCTDWIICWTNFLFFVGQALHFLGGDRVCCCPLLQQTTIIWGGNRSGCCGRCSGQCRGGGAGWWYWKKADDRRGPPQTTFDGWRSGGGKLDKNSSSWEQDHNKSSLGERDNKHLVQPSQRSIWGWLFGWEESQEDPEKNS